MSFLPRKTRQVFLMLGTGCNMNCTYCLQHALVHKTLTAEINPEIYDFLKEMAVESDAKLRLMFYGGEPLIYFPTIKEVVENTECEYSIITNGKAITEEAVAFFNAHKFSVAVSWDGRKSSLTRGCDVFADEKRKTLLLQLNNLCISGVVSSLAYPMELLEDFQTVNDLYREIHGYGIGVNLDEIMDIGLPDKSLLEIDYSRVSREAETLANLFLQNERRAEDYTKHFYIDRIIKSLQNFAGSEERYTVFCGNGLSVLNVDLAGNLYPCHNTSERIGDIHTPFYKYLQRVLAGDSTAIARQVCTKCAAYPFCRGGCKLVKDKKDYCKLKQALYLPMLHAFTEEVKNHERNN